MPRRHDQLPRGGTHHPDGSFTQGRGKARKTIVLEDAIIAIAAENAPVTIRGLFYLLVAAKVVDKTESAYDRIGDLASDLRRNGRLPYSHIIDNTRSACSPSSGDTDPMESIRTAIDDLADYHFRDVTELHDKSLIVWCEKSTMEELIKKALSGLYYIGVNISRGYGSVTFLHDAAQNILRDDRPTKIMYIGDSDKHGENIEAKMKEELAFHGAFPEIERIAVTATQIRELDLPTRPEDKDDPDSRQVTEVDAIPPKIFTKIVREKVVNYIGEENIAAVLKRQEEDRAIIRRFAEKAEMLFDEFKSGETD